MFLPEQSLCRTPAVALPYRSISRCNAVALIKLLILNIPQGGISKIHPCAYSFLVYTYNTCLATRYYLELQPFGTVIHTVFTMPYGRIYEISPCGTISYKI